MTGSPEAEDRSKKVRTKEVANENRRKGAGMLKAALFTAVTCALFALVYQAVNSGAFTLSRVVIEGNRHLGKAELMELMELRGTENLATLDLEGVYENLHASPWIKEASLRKELPGTLHIRLMETRPLAMLRASDGMYIVDASGIVLDRIVGQPASFLPVIVYARPDGSTEFNAALELAEAIRESGLMSERESVEIVGLDKGINNIELVVDGMKVKFGDGQYREKLDKFYDLAEEIGRRVEGVEYIDLRFANRVVVKSAQEAVQ